MNDQTHDDDELEARLATLDAERLAELDGPAALNQSTWAITAHWITRQRRRRRTAGVLALAGAYACGVVTVVIAFGERTPAAVSTMDTQAHLMRADVSMERESSATEAALAPPLLDPEQLALLLARSEPGAQARLLKEAGDAWLLERDDMRTAIRYYRNYLDRLAVDEQARVNVDDTWLLMALRTGRMENAT